jgi:hypothetical protein
MRGPLPKPPALRRRRNRVLGAVMLPAEGRQGPVPRLPNRRTAEGQIRPWHPLTRHWWRDVWRSRMATQYDALDECGLLALAELWDQFWCNPTARLSTEIMRQGRGYGLTPADRARLHWTIERDEDVPDKRHRQPVSRSSRRENPRRVLEPLSGPEDPLNA